MKKRVFGKKLSRSRSARKAMYRLLIRGLVENGQIKTTKAKAKGLQRQIDKLIKKAQKSTLAGRREVHSFLGSDKKTAEKILKKITKEFGDKKSGFTKIVHLPVRRGDSAEMVRLSWSIDIKEEKTTKKGKSRSQKKGKKEKEPKKKSKLREIIEKGKKDSKGQVRKGAGRVAQLPRKSRQGRKTGE